MTISKEENPKALTILARVELLTKNIPYLAKIKASLEITKTTEPNFYMEYMIILFI